MSDAELLGRVDHLPAFTIAENQRSEVAWVWDATTRLFIEVSWDADGGTSLGRRHDPATFATEVAPTHGERMQRWVEEVCVRG